jgi:hypothetical protein
MHVVGWLVGSLFYDALPITRLYSVDDRVTSEWWLIGKDLVGNSRGLILRYYPGISLERLRKATKYLNQDSRSPGPRFESVTSRIRSRSVNYMTTRFGLIHVVSRDLYSEIVSKELQQDMEGFNCIGIITWRLKFKRITNLIPWITSSWKVNGPSASQEIPRLLWTLKLHCLFHKIPSLVYILSWLNPIHIFILILFSYLHIGPKVVSLFQVFSFAVE